MIKTMYSGELIMINIQFKLGTETSKRPFSGQSRYSGGSAESFRQASENYHHLTLSDYYYLHTSINIEPT